jgi:hypothetical protein
MRTRRRCEIGAHGVSYYNGEHSPGCVRKDAELKLSCLNIWRVHRGDAC